MGHVVSVNVGASRPIASKSGLSGIDKRPVLNRVLVRAPGSKSEGRGSGVAGDAIIDRHHHGGDEQAVYAYALEDLRWWEERIGERLPCGHFGENLTTAGIDVTSALIGEIWRIGPALRVQVTGPRIPCVTFQTWMGRPGWLRTFTAAARPGAYLRVVDSGDVGAGDAVVLDRPDSHEVTVGMTFRALTREPDLLAEVLAADAYLTDEMVLRARRREPFPGF